MSTISLFASPYPISFLFLSSFPAYFILDWVLFNIPFVSDNSLLDILFNFLSSCSRVHCAPLTYHHKHNSQRYSTSYIMKYPLPIHFYFSFLNPHMRIYFLLSLEREGGGERETEQETEKKKHWCERETLINCLPYGPLLRIKLTP